MQEFDGNRRDNRSGFRRFCQHAISGGKRRGHLSGENGKGKVPGGNARNQTPCGSLLQRSDLSGIVTQKIHGFAQFRNGVYHVFAGFTSQRREQLAKIFFIKVRGPVQDTGAIAHALL